MSKALRKQGAEVLSEKKCPLPVNALHNGLKLITGELLYGDKGREHLEEEASCDRFPVDHGRVHKNIYV
ncbi:MAG: hypothetical protein JRI33_07125 [Deltaproteobacteria bacterium]|nr:hypothetical protein [Deltaproteobacteria bacterium]MBW1967702.1 hypothetical protein [Deltaproteobacteria bacterium]MBW2098698.1 hypothetical protein [Deltaproteobacteria bacterium]